MGGKASKLKKTTLVKCTMHDDGSRPVICGAPTADPIEGIKGKGGRYKVGGKEVVQFKDQGLIKKPTTVLIDGKVRAYVTKPTNSGLASLTEGKSYILQEHPSFDGQVPMDEKSLAKHGFDKGPKLYCSAMIENKTGGMTKNSSRYFIVDGAPGKWKELYRAEKDCGMNFYSIVKSSETGEPVAKAIMTGMTLSVTFDVAKGVDLAAVLLTGQKDELYSGVCV